MNSKISETNRGGSTIAHVPKNVSPVNGKFSVSKLNSVFGGARNFVSANPTNKFQQIMTLYFSKTKPYQ